MAVCACVSRRAFFASLSGTAGSLSSPEGRSGIGLGGMSVEDFSCFEGSTGRGLGEKWLAWDAISAAIPPADSGRF